MGDYSTLKLRNTDSEYKQGKLTGEKQQLEKDIYTSCNDFSSKETHYKIELNSVNRSIEARAQESLELSLNIRRLQNASTDNQLEIAHLTKTIEEAEYLGNELRKKNLLLEEEIDHMSRGKKENESHGLRLQVETNSVNREYEETKKKYLELDARYEGLSELYYKAKNSSEILSKSLNRKEDELSIVKETKQAIEKDIDREIDLHSQTSTDKKIMEEQLKRKEIDLMLKNKKIDELKSISDIISTKETQLKHQINSTELSTIEYREQLKKAEQEKQLYEKIADHNKKDAELNKKIRESEMTHSIELLTDKKRLEERLKDKMIEATIAKRDLNYVQESHHEVLEDKLNKERELEALKEHADILSSQNYSLNRELDNVVHTDEQIKNDLNRRGRIQNIKEKNELELQRSAEKVRLSKSPVKPSG